LTVQVRTAHAKLQATVGWRDYNEMTLHFSQACQNDSNAVKRAFEHSLLPNKMS